jgi:hypothetical protein
MLCGLLVVVVTALALLSALPARAESSEIIPNISEELDPGWTRLAPDTLQHVVGSTGDVANVEIKVSSVPITMDDNETLIDNKWYLQVDPSGQWWFENGNNVFKSRVTDSRISVLDKRGRLTNYSSVLSIDKSYKNGMPRVVDDPLTGSSRSCLAWDYGKYAKNSTLTRYLRSNNGRLSELWVLTGDPKTSIIFRPNISQEDDYGATTTPIIVFDSDYRIIDVVANPTKGYYAVSPGSLANAKYPVYVDPTYNFNTTSDAWIDVADATYNTAWTAATGTLVNGDFPAWVGQSLFIGIYSVDKSYVIFDTSTVPTGLNISSVSLYLFGYLDESDTDFSVMVCSGQPTYPHSPVVAGDFSKSFYATDSGGGFATSTGWSTSGYNQVHLNNTGWINKGGTTKLALRSSKDILGTAPIGDEKVSFWQSEHGISTIPYVTIVGTIPLTTPVVVTNPASLVATTSATLNGYLSDDGGASCTTQFQYGTTPAYGSTTAWVSGFVTGQTFSSSVVGLTPGTVYHFRGVAVNSFGTGYGFDTTFTAAPLPPTSLTAVGGNAQVSLTWTKGTGADKTTIVRKTGSYPTTVLDGTVVYNNVGANVVDSPLTNGTLYFYSAWSLAADGVTYSLTPAQSSATPQALADPTVVTLSAYGVGVATATLQGNLTSLGGYANTDVTFQYYFGGGTWTDNETAPPETLTATGTFEKAIAGLNAATTYHFRAKAVNTHGTSYGASVDFTTSGNSAPTMTSNAASGLQINGAQLNGTVTSDGGAPPVTVWFQYGLTVQYELGSTPSAAGLVTSDSFYYGLTGLVTNTTYHFRAVGQNALGTTYGNDQSFVTLSATGPTVNSNAATSVGAAQATLQGTLLTDGGSSCALTFEWGPTGIYGHTVTATPSTGTSGTTFSAIITGLTVGVTYHFRADATNNGGTGNGADTTFTTVFTAPTEFIAVAISSSTINLSWTLQGDQTFVNYKTTGYPVDRNDGIQVYFGLDTHTSLSGLDPGTTYYFSAWSWKAGNIWTTTNSNAIATTYASTGGNQIPAPTVPAGQEPTVSTSWFDVPTNAIIRNFPLYDIVIGWATPYQIPEGTFWAIVSLFLSTLIGALIFVTWKQAVPAVGGSLVVVVIFAVLQACPPIFAAFIAAIEVGGAYGLMSLGGNITGR